MKKIIIGLLALSLGSVAGAITTDDIAKEFDLTKKDSQLCSTLSHEFKGISGYSANLPLFAIKEYKMISLTLAAHYAIPNSTFSKFSDQKWEDLGNDFVKFTATTVASSNPSETITMYFDTHDRYKTDVCIIHNISK